MLKLLSSASLAAYSQMSAEPAPRFTGTGWVRGAPSAFLPVLPPKKFNDKDEISVEAYSGIADLFRTIDNLERVDHDDDEDGTPSGIGVQMSPEAKRIWTLWSDQNNELAAELGGFLGGFYTKLEAHVARLALILHILTHATDDPAVMISGRPWPMPSSWGEFFRGQMQLFLPMLISGA